MLIADPRVSPPSKETTDIPLTGRTVTDRRLSWSVRPHPTPTDIPSRILSDRACPAAAAMTWGSRAGSGGVGTTIGSETP